uniref:Uncharacterized protein n=1 Tax=Anguilla anguilla TaxID=7936 RepID=A0A0E9UNP4_ANGAN
MCKDIRQQGATRSCNCCNVLTKCSVVFFCVSHSVCSNVFCNYSGGTHGFSITCGPCLLES